MFSFDGQKLVKTVTKFHKALNFLVDMEYHDIISYQYIGKVNSSTAQFFKNILLFYIKIVSKKTFTNLANLCRLTFLNNLNMDAGVFSFLAQAK